MRFPAIYRAHEIATWQVAEEYEPGKWTPCRPCPYEAESLSHWLMLTVDRFRIAWLVFTGKCDALSWRRR